MSTSYPPPPPTDPPYSTFPPPPEYVEALRPPKTGMATTSLVLGILSLSVCACGAPVMGLIAIILGGIAVSRASHTAALYGGKGRAIGGIVTGALGLVVFVIGAASASAILPRLAGSLSSSVNLGLVGTGLQQYQTRYNDFPPDLQTLSQSAVMANMRVTTPGGSDGRGDLHSGRACGRPGALAAGLHAGHDCRAILRRGIPA
jgi:hypothetical protein